MLGVRFKWPNEVEGACKGDGTSDGDEGGEIGGGKEDGEAGKEDWDGWAWAGTGPEDVRGGEFMLQGGSVAGLRKLELECCLR